MAYGVPCRTFNIVDSFNDHIQAHPYVLLPSLQDKLVQSP
ncbi:hypothetical protein GGD46_004250 [Rhizobium lusitanum]|uniref:Uncharacterized protein n=1 Tax=Rhizobium lusitanum TaxID=293958 RepID=A0A7X0MDZ5_9HYPH|nr:hypothetical protein [Rhizobium lusitanum]